MDAPILSVVVPTYNQAAFLPISVQSVLNQTYVDFEVIVVDDASTDNTGEVMSRFEDPRVRYIVHKRNRYAAAARNTGISASRGKFLAFLDADDRMHPSKLRQHIAYLEEHSDVGLSYSCRLTIDQTGNPLAIETSPSSVRLQDLVLGYPFAPSEIVMRKEWALHVGLFDESFTFHGEDPDFHLRLALQGCRMAGLDQVLSYRRLNSERVFKNLREIVEDEVRAFENVFADAECPREVLALRDISLGRLYLGMSFLAFFQAEVELGRELMKTALGHDRSILKDANTTLLDSLTHKATRDDGDHHTRLKHVFEQLPGEVAWLRQYSDYAIGRGYLIRGCRDITWGRIQNGIRHLEKASGLDAHLDESMIQLLTVVLMRRSKYLGDDPTKMLEDLVAGLAAAGYQVGLRRLKASYWINKAFESYRDKTFAPVPTFVMRTVINAPRYVTDRGAWSILLRSVVENLNMSSRGG